MAFNYYLGPYVSFDFGSEIGWSPPPGFQSLDLGIASQRALDPTTNSERGLGLFWGEGTLSTPTYTFLGNGDVRSLSVTNRVRNALVAVAGEEPQGTTLVDCLWDLFTRLSDPSGVNGVRPLMPTRNGQLELHLSRHSAVRSEPFVLGIHSHSAKVLANIQRDYRQVYQDVIAGSRSPGLHQKMLTTWKRQYGIQDEGIFIPADLPNVKGIDPATTYTEDFDDTNGSPLGPNLTWTDTTGACEIQSNHAEDVGQDGLSEARAEHDVSSVDHYTQWDHLSSSGTGADDETRGLVRFDSGARTHYGAYALNNAANDVSIFRRESGTFTGLTTLSQARLGTMKLEVTGSTLTYYDDGSSIDTTTDTNISGNTRGGIVCRNVGELDNFVFSDFNVSGSGGVTTPMPTLSGSGSLVFSGSGGVTLPIPTLSGTGYIFVGSGGVSLPIPTLSGTGSLVFSGSGGVTLPMPTLAGTGNTFAGSGGVSLKITLAGSGSVPITAPFEGAGGVKLPMPIIDGHPTGIGNVSTPSIQLSGSGFVPFTGAGGVSLPGIQLQGTGSHPYIGSGGVTVRFSLSGKGKLPFSLLPISKVLSTGEFRKLRKQHNKNISSLLQTDPETAIKELQKAVRDLQLEVEELHALSTYSLTLDDDGKPAHGSYCGILDGQFVHVVSHGIGVVVPILHGMKRRPQGVIWVLNGRNADVYVAGDLARGIPPADDKVVYAEQFGASGDVSVGVLF